MANGEFDLTKISLVKLMPSLNMTFFEALFSLSQVAKIFFKPNV